MLPEFLESTYKRYKKDTSFFLRWLSETGEKLGYTIDGSVEKGGQRPAKPTKSEKAKSSKGQTSNSGQVLLPLKELVPLAEAIANSNIKVFFGVDTDQHLMLLVPTGVLKAGFRAIILRKRQTEYFTNKAKTKNKASLSNKGHSYFTSLMEEALEILRPRFPRSAQAFLSNQDLGALEIRLSALDRDDFVHKNTQTNDGASDTRPTTYDVEKPSDQANWHEEKLLAIFCLFDDFNKLRTVIQKAWIGFLIGQNDIIIASSITNTAFQLAIRTQEEFLADYPSDGDYHKLIANLMFMLQETPEGHFNLAGLEINDSFFQWIFAPAYQLLDSFCGVLQPGQLPLMKRGHLGVYNSAADRKTSSFEENQHQDLILLLEILPEFAFLSWYKATLMAEDELTKGLRKMCETKQIPIWLTFATTAFLDIHHYMKDKADLPHKELLKLGKNAVATFEHYFDFSRDIPHPTQWTDGIENTLHEFCGALKTNILSDPTFSVKKANYRKISEEPGASEIFYLYKGHPTLCGLLAYRIQLEMQYFGISLCNGWGTVIHPAHLYNALRTEEGSQVSPWALMDQVIEVHGEDRLFVGKKPENIIDASKQISIVLGYSTEQFAENRRNATPVMSNHGPRGLKNTSALSEIFRHGLGTDGSMALTMKNIEELFNEQAKVADLGSAKSKNKRQLLRTEWATTKRLSSVQLLEALGISLQEEVRLLEINYFQTHEKAVTLLRELNNVLQSDFENHFGERYIENESQLPFVCAYIIMISSGSMKSAQALGIRNAKSGLLIKAGEVYEKFLERQKA